MHVFIKELEKMISELFSKPTLIRLSPMDSSSLII